MLKHHSSQYISRLRVISHVFLKLLFCLKPRHWKEKRNIHTDMLIPLVVVWYSPHVHLFSCLSYCSTLMLAILTDSQDIGLDGISILNHTANTIKTSPHAFFDIGPSPNKSSYINICMNVKTQNMQTGNNKQILLFRFTISLVLQNYVSQ